MNLAPSLKICLHADVIRKIIHRCLVPLLALAIISMMVVPGNVAFGYSGPGNELDNSVTKPPMDVDFGINLRPWQSNLVETLSASMMLQTPALANVITAGGSHTCALTSSGGVKCWGDNYYGQLGDGTTTQKLAPVDVIGLNSGVVAIAAGGDHTCALTDGSGVKCWGRNNTGQLGDGTTTDKLTPVDVSGLTSGVSAIAAGGDTNATNGSHTCALTNSGGVKCWGDNYYGQLGDGTTTSRLTSVDVSGLTNGVAALTAGSDYTCALTDGGGAKCWGRNTYGQLGDGTTTQRLIPVDVSGLTSGVAAIVAGDDPNVAQGSHTCALTSSGGVKCWGRNSFGQLGDGTTTQRLTPVDVVGLTSGVAKIVIGYLHSCALTSGGGVKCWGNNGNGQLGDGTNIQRTSPQNVVGLTSGVATIAAGFNHACAVTSNGGIKCWGDNSYGQLGDGSQVDRWNPVDVIGLTSGIIAISAGIYHTCALTSNGGVKCWGNNASAQLGDGTTNEQWAPVDVVGMTSEVASLTAGGNHTCALTSGGGVKCWGNNVDGQLGDGTTTIRLTAVDVSGLTSGIAAIAAGGAHTCALTSSGGVKCWGNNGYGQLGDGTNMQRLTPVDVSGLTSGVIALSAGGHHTCAITSGGGVKCWGRNTSGQLGDGTTTQRPIPVDVNGLTSGMTEVAVSISHTCALSSSGGVKCWGVNGNGQLGDGTNMRRLTSVDANGLTSEVAVIATGNYHTCALTNSGGAKCWGYNASGQVGDGTNIQRLTPVDVSGLSSGITALAGGRYHTCALTSAGGVKCWGDNYYGQLGIGTGAYSRFPVDTLWTVTNNLQLVWSADTSQSYANFAASIATGDFNGDGKEDVVIGAPTYDPSPSASDVGAVFVYYGSSNGLTSEPVILSGSDPKGRFGWSVATVGDVDGDGNDDLLVGAPGCSKPQKNEGCAYLYLGSPTGLSTTPIWSLEGNQPYSSLGYVVGSAGNVNADTYADFFVGAPNYSKNYIQEGKLMVFYGTNGSLSSDPDWSALGGRDYAYFGLTASAAGDVNLNSFDDLLVGAPGFSNGLEGQGKVYLYPGSADGLATTAAWSMEGDQVQGRFGEALSAGDVNGDGYSDVAVGAGDYDHGEVDEGAVFVYLGSETGLSASADWIGESNQAGANYGVSVSMSGDVNGDNHADLLVGANRYSNGEQNEGKVYLYYGSSAGFSATPDWELESNQAYSNFGYIVAMVGDVNGDGVTGFLIGAPQMDGEQANDAGRVFQYKRE